MPESEFDKQVQREMDGLRLRPSATVWKNVERELRRKKRRRVLVFFWLLAGLGLLGYSTYYLTQKGKSSLAGSSYAPAGNPGKPSPQSAQQPGQHIDNEQFTASPANPANGQQDDVQQQPLKETSSTASTSTSSGTPATDDQLNAQRVKAPASDRTIKQPTAVDGNQLVSTSASGDKRGKTPKKVGGKNQSPVTGEGAFVTGNRKNNKKKPAAGLEEPVAKTGTDITQPQKEDQQVAVIPEPAKALPSVPSTDSVKANADSAVAAVVPPVETKAPQVKTPSSSKIKWALDLGVGVSGPISSPFLIGGGGGPDKSNDPQAQNGVSGPGAPLTPPGSFGPVYTPRSDINPGPSFRVGILGEWAISKRISIASGLQYQYQSNNIRTGFYTDTLIQFDNYASQPVSVNSLYRGGSQKTFTNRFHYLQVPLTFQWQMNAGKKVPIILNAGIAAGYLLTTNALAYDSLQGGVYYHDKNAFNRFQFSFTTGVAFRFGNNKAFQWSIGPEVSMGLNSQVKELYDKKQYPLYFGIQGRLYWPRKR